MGQRRRGCVTGKRGHRDSYAAKKAAKGFARLALQRKEYVQDMYLYVCPHCHRYHLTHDPIHEGAWNDIAYVAPPVALQTWAMTTE